MNAQRDDAVSAFCNFAVGLKDEDVPAQTRANVHKFVLDSFGVGIAGSCGSACGSIDLYVLRK